ncbi:anthrax toxin lethal factor-related metalloendopeptidase [Shouchella lonarensis]|uniref:ATLF-like domain-containing protein n=1 Tax=Shouchella lonarensis TaxID=1464122 RepID=A0A1G6MPH7_9BACI|nr:hypothetical protein [Shouchella lonarensis]SDC57429.1 hypothetical protein SAMN05421737_11099 [Shouchella lonarensis]
MMKKIFCSLLLLISTVGSASYAHGPGEHLTDDHESAVPHVNPGHLEGNLDGLNHTEKDVPADEYVPQFLNQLILIETSGAYDQQEANNMVNRLQQIDEQLLYALYIRNIRIKLINFPITHLPEYAHLRGIVPRGWEGTGYTWDHVPGIGGNPAVARIGYSDYGNMHTSINLELHEVAHAIDIYVFGYISYSTLFRQIHAYERFSFSNSSYYAYPEEYFAETFAYYYRSPQSRQTLYNRAPYTYWFIQTLTSRLY